MIDDISNNNIIGHINTKNIIISPLTTLNCLSLNPIISPEPITI